MGKPPALGHIEWSVQNDPTRWGAPGSLPEDHPEHFTGTCPTCGQEFLRAEIARLRSTLETIAAQNSGIPGSTSRADCMAALALAALHPVLP